MIVFAVYGCLLFVGRFLLSLIQLHHYLSHEDGMLAVLVVGRGVAVSVVDISELLEISVTVAPEYEVDAARMAYHFLVAHAIFFPSQVSNSKAIEALFSSESFAIIHSCFMSSLMLGNCVSSTSAALSNE